MHVPGRLVSNPIELAALLSATGVIATCAVGAALTFLAGSDNGERRAALTP
jgi:hypothetical protein